MRQVPTETNDEYFDKFNSQLQNVIPSGWKMTIFSLKTMDKVRETDTTEEATNKEEKFKSIFLK